jgi:hypothetical protein
MHLTIHDRVVLLSSDYLPDTVSFVARLAEMDQGGFIANEITLVAKTPESLIELGKDLMLAGAQLRQFVAEWPEGTERVPELPREAVANGHTSDKAA